MLEHAGTLSFTAERILLSDRAKSPEWGGQKLTSVKSVEVGVDELTELPMVRVRTEDGREASSPILPHALIRPKDREMRPADMHDAVRAALFSATEALPAPLS